MLEKNSQKNYKLNFIDLDHYIEQIENRTISDIFIKEGEDHFRKLELKYFTSILKRRKHYYFLRWRYTNS